MKDIIEELYQELKGTRIINGELFVEDFEEEDYEEIYFYILGELQPLFKGNYVNWYEKKALSYYRYKQRTNRKDLVYIPQKDKPIEEQSTREQLALLKFFISRRRNGSFNY